MEAALQVALQAALVLQPPELLLVVPLVARLIAPTVSLLVLLALLPLVCLVLDLQGWLQALDLCAHDRVDPGVHWDPCARFFVAGPPLLVHVLHGQAW